MLARGTGPAKHLPFVLQSDVEHVVLVKNGADGKQTKEITTVSGAIFAGLDNGLPDLGMNYVELDPMKKMVEGNEVPVFSRFNVKMQQSIIAFTPKQLTDDALAGPIIKKAMFGALFADKYDRPARNHAKLVWEVEMHRTSPAHLRTIKAKHWLMGTLDMEAGNYYRPL